MPVFGTGRAFTVFLTAAMCQGQCGVSTLVKPSISIPLCERFLENLIRQGILTLSTPSPLVFFRLKGPIDRDNLDEKKAKKLLEEFRSIVGDDPIEAEIQKRERDRAKTVHQQSVANQKDQAKRLEAINTEFLSLVTTSEFTPQQRGFKLEKLFFQLLHLSDIEHSKPYRTQGGEQIDGHFKYEKFDYLVEAKWTQEAAKQPELSVFDGKIRGKAQSTRGFFVSANGFDDSAVQKYSGDSPRIILMTGEDLTLVLSGRVHFADAMKAKVDSIVRRGVILFPVRDVAT